jgi:hypothetical protein
MRAALSNLLEDDGILVILKAPAPPKLRSKGRQLEDFLSSAFSLLSVVGMSGCCQDSVPLGKYCCRKISLRTGRSPLRLDLNPRQKNA